MEIRLLQTSLRVWRWSSYPGLSGLALLKSKSEAKTEKVEGNMTTAETGVM